jgi:very-short-patch-repair endonuclease
VKLHVLYALAAIIVVLIVVMLAYLASTRGGRVRLVAKPIMTPIERETFGYIQAAVPQLRVYAQVAMGALLRTEPGMSRQDAARLRNRFSQKIVDYVIEDPASGEVVALVELDDRTHNADRDHTRDAMTAAAGYFTIRLPAGERPTLQNVRSRVTDGLETRRAAIIAAQTYVTP